MGDGYVPSPAGIHYSSTARTFRTPAHNGRSTAASVSAAAPETPSARGSTLTSASPPWRREARNR